MDGFVKSYDIEGDTQDKGAHIMECFNPTTGKLYNQSIFIANLTHPRYQSLHIHICIVPCISTLATEFAIFDHWFCSGKGQHMYLSLYLISNRDWSIGSFTFIQKKKNTNAVPGPTFPNRLFGHSATSNGATLNDFVQLALGYPQRTIFDKYVVQYNIY